MIFTLVDTVDVLLRVYMRVRGWIAPIGVTRTSFGFTLKCDLRDFIQRRVFFFGIYEPNLTHYIRSRVKTGDTFVDVGANVGYVTLLASTLVGKRGEVVAIEASPQTFGDLSRNLALNDASNVLALNLAAAGAKCQVEIVSGEARNSGSNSIRLAKSTGTSLVPGDRLSDLLVNKSRVAFIKIDIEGSEGPVLRNILDNLDEFVSLESIAVELTAGSQQALADFQAAGFKAFALPNNYRIGYMLVREYLSRSHEDGFVVKIPVTTYSADFTDYVFERSVSKPALGRQGTGTPATPATEARVLVPEVG